MRLECLIQHLYYSLLSIYSIIIKDDEYTKIIVEIQNFITEFLLVLKDYICFAILIIPRQNQTV